MVRSEFVSRLRRTLKLAVLVPQNMLVQQTGASSEKPAPGSVVIASILLLRHVKVVANRKPPSEAIGSVARMVTSGGRLVGGGGRLVSITEILTGVETAVAPRLSVASAVKT